MKLSHPKTRRSFDMLHRISPAAVASIVCVLALGAGSAQAQPRPIHASPRRTAPVTIAAAKRAIHEYWFGVVSSGQLRVTDCEHETTTDVSCVVSVVVGTISEGSSTAPIWCTEIEDVLANRDHRRPKVVIPPN